MPDRLLRHLTAILALAWAVLACLVPGYATATQPVSPLAQGLEDFLQQQAQHLSGQVVVQSDVSNVRNAHTCQHTEFFLPVGTRLRSRFSVGVQCLAPDTWTAYVPVQLQVLGQYPVASRPLPPSTLLTPDDISLRDGDLMRLPSGVALDIDDVLGYTTTQRIAAQQTFRRNALHSPGSITKGQAVRLEIRGNGFTVTTEGVALQGAEPGAMVQVRTSNGQVITGRVLDPRTVLILM